MDSSILTWLECLSKLLVESVNLIYFYMTKKIKISMHIETLVYDFQKVLQLSLKKIGLAKFLTSNLR